MTNAVLSMYRLAALEHRFPWAGCSVLSIVIENPISSAVKVWKNPQCRDNLPSFLGMSCCTEPHYYVAAASRATDTGSEGTDSSPGLY